MAVSIILALRALTRVAVSVQTLIGVVFTERPGEVCEGHILIGHNYCQSCRVRKNWPVTAGDIRVIITTSQSPPSHTLSYNTQ